MSGRANLLIGLLVSSGSIYRKTKRVEDQRTYEEAQIRLEQYIEELECKSRYWDDLLKREAEDAKERDLNWIL